MAKGRRGNRLPPFVPLTWDLLNSKAYIDLPASPAKALPYFLGKVKASYNNPQRYLMEFSFSYSEGKRLGFASATFSHIIKELIKKGFIDPVDKGGLRSDGKSYNIFRLSKRWQQYGNADFKVIEWECFFPRLRARSYFKNGNV